MVEIGEAAQYMRQRFGSRKRTRVPGFDYRMPGPYFITICVQDRLPLLGSVDGEAAYTNARGDMVAHVWLTAPEYFSGVVLDAFVVMPNHFHAVLTLGPHHVDGNPTLGDVIKWFKTLTTVEYVKGVSEHGWPRFHDRLWQRRSYDHIIRDESDLERVRAYIEANPWNWSRDDLYAAHDPAFAK